MNDPDLAALSFGVGSADAELSTRKHKHVFLKEHGRPTLIGLIAVIVVTVIMMAFSDHFVRGHLIFFYLFPITSISMYYSSTPALVTSIASVLGTSYLLFPPIFSFRISEPLQVVELLMFAIFAFIASKASSRLLR